MAEERQSWIVGVFLFAGLLAFALLQNHKVGFEVGHHGFLSSHGSTLARNLSFRTGFLLYNRVTVGADGERRFEPYGGFPIYPFAMIGSIMALFPNRLDLQVYAARQLMNLFCWGSLVVSYLILLRLTGSRWRALAASFLAFSSVYLSYYNDMIFNDIPALFGFLLLLLAITHRLTGSDRPFLLYAAVLVAISLGWQALGVLGCWWVSEICGLGLRDRVRQAVAHPATKALMLAILWGALNLGYGLIGEWRVTQGGLAEMRTYRAMTGRLGLEGSPPGPPREDEWSRFAPRQVRRLAKASIPTPYLHARVDALAERSGAQARSAQVVLLLIALLAAVRAARAFAAAGAARRPILILMLSGFFWILPMRHFTAFHDFQSLFYVGFPLGLYALLLQNLNETALKAVALVAFGLFVFAHVEQNREKDKVGQEVNVFTADFQGVDRLIGTGKKVCIDGDDKYFAGGRYALNFYLAGNYFSECEVADYVLAKRPDFNRFGLTPTNRKVFLFAHPRDSAAPNR